jgi:hypothetical protein
MVALAVIGSGGFVVSIFLPADAGQQRAVAEA